MTGNILFDIGDGQSISENLSTFSSHIKNVIQILENTNDKSFVLLDELESGTDSADGIGIVVSILEKLKNMNCLFVATTHYPEVKEEGANIVPYSIGFNIFMDINDMRDVFSRNDDYYNVLLSYDKLDIESGRVYSITSQDDLLKVAPNIRKSMSSITYLMIIGSILTYIVVMYLMILPKI